MYRKLLLNIPHSSLEGIFDRGLCPWSVNEKFYNEVILKWTDLFTDIVFGSDDPRIEAVRAGYSRFVADCERLEHDPLESIGQGVVYTEYSGYSRQVSEEDKQRLTENIWRAHQLKLSAAIEEGTLLLDCHSFPSDYCPEIDICIGYNDDQTKPSEEVIALIVRKFEDKGYIVGVNKPYGNSIAPSSDIPYHSLMIEINKRIYMDERCHTLDLSPNGEPKFKAILQEIYSELLD